MGQCRLCTINQVYINSIQQQKMDYNLYVSMVHSLPPEWLTVLYIVNDVINSVYCIYSALLYKRHSHLLSRLPLV